MIRKTLPSGFDPMGGNRFSGKINAPSYAAMTTRITIRKPDDWHLHVRDGEMLKAVLPYTARQFGRAV